MAAAEAVAEEARELAEASDPESAFVEVGDLLFAIVSLARRMKVNPEDALRVAGQRFRERFRQLEASIAAEGRTFRDFDADELVRRWEKTH